MRISTPNRQSVLRALLDATPLPMLVGTAEPEMRLLAVNRLFSRLFGYRRADLDANDSWWSLAFPDPIYRSQVAASWGVALGRGFRAALLVELHRVVRRAKAQARARVDDHAQAVVAREVVAPLPRLVAVEHAQELARAVARKRRLDLA